MPHAKRATRPHKKRERARNSKADGEAERRSGRRRAGGRISQNSRGDATAKPERRQAPKADAAEPQSGEATVSCAAA